MELMLEVAPEVLIKSIITKRSCEELGIAVGKSAYVVIKAFSVMLGVD